MIIFCSGIFQKMIQNFQKSGFFWPKLSTFFWQKLSLLFNRKWNFIYRKTFQNFKSRTKMWHFLIWKLRFYVKLFARNLKIAINNSLFFLNFECDFSTSRGKWHFLRFETSVSKYRHLAPGQVWTQDFDFEMRTFWKKQNLWYPR